MYDPMIIKSSILAVTTLGITVAPAVIFEYESLNINLNYFIASIIGWLLGWLLNPHLSVREILGGLIVAVIITMFIGSGINSLIQGTFLDYKEVNGLVIVILSASGLPWLSKMVEVVQMETPEIFKRWLQKLVKSDKND